MKPAPGLNEFGAKSKVCDIQALFFVCKMKG